MALSISSPLHHFEGLRERRSCVVPVRCSFKPISPQRIAPGLRRPGRFRYLCSSVYNSPKLRPDEASPLGDVTEESSVDGERRHGEDEGETKEPASLWGRIKGWFKMDKSRLQNLGIGAFLAYGFVSNVNSGVFLTIAWLTHVKRTGMIPFAQGQWQSFLAVYGGLWAIQNVMRPLRIAAAIALTPLVNHMLLYLVNKLGIQRRQAVLLLLFGLAVFTTSSLVTAIWILGGIPARPPKPI